MKPLSVMAFILIGPLAGACMGPPSQEDGSFSGRPPPGSGPTSPVMAGPPGFGITSGGEKLSGASVSILNNSIAEVVTGTQTSGSLTIRNGLQGAIDP